MLVSVRPRPAYLCLGLAFICLLLSLPLSADTLTVGDNGGAAMANIFPFGSTGGPGYSDPGSTFQQIYSAGAFSGPITITGVSFASANGEGGSGGTFVGAVTISLGTSAQTAANVSDTYADIKAPT